MMLRMKDLRFIRSPSIAVSGLYIHQPEPPGSTNCSSDEFYQFSWLFAILQYGGIICVETEILLGVSYSNSDKNVCVIYFKDVNI